MTFRQLTYLTYAVIYLSEVLFQKQLGQGTVWILRTGQGHPESVSPAAMTRSRSARLLSWGHVSFEQSPGGLGDSWPTMGLVYRE